MNRVLASVVLSLACAAAASAKDLVGAFHDAQQNDPQIRAADANRLASREARPQAWAALLPQISGTGSWTKDKQNGSISQFGFDPNSGGVIAVPFALSSQSWITRFGVTADERIFSYSNLMALRGAGAQVAQAEAAYHAAEQNLILRLSQAYFTALTAQDTLDANQASLEAIDRQLDQANKRFDVGLIAITDVEEAKAARDSAAAAVIAAKRALATSVDQLSEITGQKYDSLSKPGDHMPLNNPEPASEDKWVDLSMDQNQTLVATRLGADVARDNVQVAFGGHVPTIDIVAQRTQSNTAELEAFGPSVLRVPANVSDRSIAFQISVPIFSGGGTQSKVRQAQYQWIAAKENVVQSSRATERQARDAYLGVIAGIAQVQSLRQALESNQVALKATEAGNEVGTRTAVDVLNSRRLLVAAQTDYARSRYDYILSIIQLRLAAGILAPKDLEEINSWLDVVEATTPAAPLSPSNNAPPPPGATVPGATPPPGPQPANTPNPPAPPTPAQPRR
jgi:outer membrane protein